MPIRSILLLVFFIPSAGFGQIKYENGYFISNDDNKIECLIKNNDWSSNPLEFRYKSQASNDNVITANIKVVKEFGVANSKYIRANVKIDKSKEDANLLTNNGNPEWVEQEVFLEVLVEGQVNLYSYKERNLERYFYSTDGSTIHQLVYKVFRFKNDQMGFNREFINQLKSISGCTSLPTSLAERINYHSKGDWIDYFERYDECKGTKSIYNDSKHKIDINLRFTPGIDNSFIDVQTEFLTIPFDKIQNARIGMELEFVLPINKGKWSVIAEPTYRYYRQTNEKYVNFFIDYRSIELPIGLTEIMH